jgi:hypothetical protein
MLAARRFTSCGCKSRRRMVCWCFEIREMEVLVRWATVHWDQLREALGFERDQPPCATTISRTLAKCRVAEFQAAWAAWLRACVTETSTSGGLIDADAGKTRRQRQLPCRLHGRSPT